MKKAMIFYKSRTGITRRFGENIKKYLEENGVRTGIKSIEDFNSNDLEGIDYLFLGCWTGGLMVLLQGPERAWIEFAKKLPDEIRDTQTILFTTYKLLTGSMFRNMQKHLSFSKGEEPFPAVKSRNSRLTEEGRDILNKILTDKNPKYH